MSIRQADQHTARNRKSRKTAVRAAGVLGAMVAVPALGALTATSAHAADGGTWDRIAQCESGGKWNTSTGNGFSGGLQFTQSTWSAYGGGKYASSASQATKAQQIAVATKVQQAQGWKAWPVCSGKAGASGSAPAAAAPSTASAQQAPAKKAPVQQPQKTYTQKTYTQHKSYRTAPQAPAANSAATAGGYTVKAGDTLSGIAAAHGTSWSSLYAKNTSTIGGSADVIVPGQHLNV